MGVLATKGDINETLQELLDDKTKIASDGDLLNQMLIEILLTKYGTNQLEHIQKGVEKVRTVLTKRFSGNE
jgi:hypothetical protein